MYKNSLSTNEELRQGEFLTSVNGKHKAIFQTDSNLVIYEDKKPDQKPSWQSDTANSLGIRIIIQDDMNLVMYTADGRAVWATQQNAGEPLSQRMRLTLTNQGHLEVDRDGHNIWTSATSNGIKFS